jgi:MSHA biogenesis protein MshL
MRRFLIVLALAAICASCTSAPPAKQAKERQAVERPDIPIPLVAQMETEKKVESEGANEFYSFSFREADLKDVCRAISRQTNYNIIVEPDVKGLITVDLKQVRLHKALEYILDPLNYGHRIEGRTIHVSRPKVQTKIFAVNYIALRRVGTSMVTAQTGGGSTAGTTAGTGGQPAGSSGSVPGYTGTTGSGAMGSLAVTTVTESDLWRNLEDNLKNLLSPDGRIGTNRQAMMLVITDYPKNLSDVGMFLEAIEGTIHRQVMIEAKVAEVQLNETARQGINWALLEARIGEFALKGSQTFMNPSPVPVLSSAPGIAAQPLFRFFVGNKNLDIDKTFIDLLKTQGDVNIISSPKIAAMNNQRAVIKVARQDVYFVGTTATGGAGPAISTYTPTFMTVGLILDVIPQIDNNGNVILNIHPMLTERIDSVKAPDGTSEVPILEVREVDTVVRVREGETVVIGGLIKTYWTKNQTGVQGLASVPLIGALFRAKEEVTRKSELVVFLTPRIIQKDGNERNP